MNTEIFRRLSDYPYVRYCYHIIRLCAVLCLPLVINGRSHSYTGLLEIIIIVLLSTIPLLGVVFLYRRFNTQPKQATNVLDANPQIIVTDHQITCRYPKSNKTETINWEDVDQIQVLTTDEGPRVCDVLFVLQNVQTNTGVALPQDCPETKLVFEKVQKWHGFDNENFIKAMSCTENQWFLVWKKG